MVEDIDSKPKNRGRRLLLFAHSTAGPAAFSVASRLGERVMKVYLCDAPVSVPGGFDAHESTHKFFASLSDADWIRHLSGWNPGNRVLREMATAVSKGELDAESNPAAQEVLENGRKICWPSTADQDEW
eukprot:gnl/TRDRNA2_/TRDRNA2_172441_c0_seq1.p1 gnl/TRDRNA2_/TRDRNA2_172441_c0~~gnl/TRDRNA2_/TRDRNA2_172441_c0_seq1.p1  ORF type:complete len:129 (+),score=14.76 gnl/TRDRNA2_/TRDRNA2_172441_c0_seq1:37-423(+)